MAGRRPASPLVAALKTMMAAEGTDDQNEARQAAAAEMVAERQRHQHLGMPDWNGDSRPYRAIIEQAYREAGVPSDTDDPVMHAGLRYHVRKEVRRVAPSEDLMRLAKPARPRKAAVRLVEPSPTGTAASMPNILADALDDPVGLVKFAIRSLEAARSLKPTGSDAETIRYMVKALRDAVDALAGMAGEADL